MVSSRRGSPTQSADGSPSMNPVDDDAVPEGRPSGARNVIFRPIRESQPSSIGLRRLRLQPAKLTPVTEHPAGRRPSVQPQSGDDGALQPQAGASTSAAERPTLDVSQPAGSSKPLPPIPQRGRAGSLGAGSALERQVTRESRRPSTSQQSAQDEYDPRIVDILDVIDPEVATLSSITNIQNSLFVPSLGRWVKRRPTYNLTRSPYQTDESSEAEAVEADLEEQHGDDSTIRTGGLGRTLSLQSTSIGPNYAVLPHGVSLDGWSQEEVAELNDHVRHMLHSRRSRFKRSMKAFGKYVSKPLGFLVTLYATLITLFGLAWVLFLIGWIYVGEKQLYVINVIDNVLVALFAIVGDGLAPFRAVDTYHMVFIAYYHRLTWKLRKQKALPKLENKNDLPSEVLRPTNLDLETGGQEEPGHPASVLTPKQQRRLVHHQNKFARSHTFYKPHETDTHYAFPLNLLVAIVLLLDLHSCLQISLGACTWGIDYRTRPAALTATILSCSITVNILAGILIMLGGRRTRKKDVLERMFRQELTEEALHRMRAQSNVEIEKLRKIDEAIDEADENKEDKEDESGKINLPRPSLDAFRGRRSEDHARSPRGVGRLLSPSKKPADLVGRFDTALGYEGTRSPRSPTSLRSLTAPATPTEPEHSA